LIAGQRDPKVLAGLARGRMRVKYAALVQALTGAFDAHHAELAAMLLDQIDALTAKIDILTTRIGEQVATLANPADTPAQPEATTATATASAATWALKRLVTIPGINEHAAQAIIAEIGLDMTRFPTAGHLASPGHRIPRPRPRLLHQPHQQAPRV
jgi:transposase